MAANHETEELKPLTGRVVQDGQGSGTTASRPSSALDKFLLDASQSGGDVERDPMDSIIRQVLDADSPAAVLTPTEVMQARDMVNVPLMLIDFELNKSEYDAGSPFFASMAVLLPESVPAVVNCGHKKVLAQLVKLKQFNEFPYRVMFIARGQSQQGTPMLELTAWKEEDYTDNPPF
jgi:hypothetical protein